MIFRQVVEGLTDFGCHDGRENDLGRSVRLDALVIERDQDRSRAKLSSPAVEDVEQNAKEPRSRVCATLKSIEAAPSQKQRFLNNVLGDGSVATDAASHSQKARRVWHGDSFKLVLPDGHSRGNR